MNTRTAYYDWQTHEFYDPYQDNRRVWGFSMPKLETVRWYVYVTNGRAVLSAGVPLAAYRHSLADKSNVVLALKTFENAALESTGDVSVATSGFQTGGSLPALSTGAFVHDTAVPLAVAGGIYYLEFILIDSASATESLDTGEYATTLEVRRRVFTGLEASAPSGTTGTNWYTGTIPAGSDSVALSISGVTASARGIPVQTGGGTLPGLSYTATANTITISTTGPVGEATPVSFKLESV